MLLEAQRGADEATAAAHRAREYEARADEAALTVTVPAAVGVRFMRAHEPMGDW